MSEQRFPPGWLIGQDFQPEKHFTQLERFDKAKGKKVATDYLNVQNRLIWFIRDQRAFIVAGLATTTYVINTDLVEHDREGGWAHFKAYVRDVLGNEATMYGSESVRDFPDYIEKAATKAVGRALLLLGYGTAFTAEIDEGERVVDAPHDRKPQQVRQAQSRQEATPPQERSAPTPLPRSGRPAGDAMATDRQNTSIKKLCAALKEQEPDFETLTFKEASDLLTQLSQRYSDAKKSA